MSEQKHTPTQFGTLYSADFSENHMTLEMRPGFRVAAGEVAVLDRRVYDALRDALNSILEIMEGRARRALSGAHDAFRRHHQGPRMNIDPAKLPGFIRRRMEQAIHASANPKGMGVHDGTVRVHGADLAYMLKLIDALSAVQSDREGREKDASPAPWQPIETAPKDGTEIVGAEWQAPGDGYPLELITQTTSYRDGAWRYPSGIDWEPSHWMPLPAHPVTDAKNQEKERE